MTKVWSPHAGSQVQFLACPVFECLFEGTRGPGKTDGLLMSFAQYVGSGFGPAWRGVLFRETYKQLADVVVKTKRWFRLFFPGARFLESHADYKWVFPAGEELLLRVGVKEDDYWDYHGHEYPWIGFEELTNWRSLAFYEMMHSCCRSSMPGMPRMVRATTNPYGRGHGVVKERFQISDDPRENAGRVIRDGTGRERTYVHGDILENRTLLESDPDYIATLDAIKDPNRKKAWRHGRWDINIGAWLEGAWDPQRHIVKPFPIPAHWKLWMAMDWGYAKPYAIGWFAKDPEGKTYMWRELYGIKQDDSGKLLPDVGTQETPEQVAKRIKAREEHDQRVGYDLRLRLTGPDLFARGGAQYGTQITHATTFRAAGLTFRPWWAGPGSRKAGALLVKQSLELDELAIFDTCVNTIRTVPALEPDPDDPDDVDTEGEDHCFAPLTLVVTQRGDISICDVLPGDLVLNHEGRWVPTGGARLTRRNARVIRLTLANGRHIVCTPDHRFYMGRNTFWQAKDLLDVDCYGLLEEHTCESMSSAKPFRNLMGCGTTDAARISSAKECVCTEQCGCASTVGKCLMDLRCTMQTRTGQTTSQETLNCWSHPSIANCTVKVGGWLSAFKRWAGRLQRLGMPAMLAESGIAPTTKTTQGLRCTKVSCTVAERAANHSMAQSTPSIAAQHAGSVDAGPAAPIRSSRLASTVELISRQAARTTSDSAVGPMLRRTGGLRVVRIQPEEPTDVWCLTVPDGNTFTLWAGPTVHNCFDMLKAALMRRTATPLETDGSLSGDPDAGGATVLPDGRHRIDRVQR